MKRFILLAMLLSATSNAHSNEYTIQLETVNNYTKENSEQFNFYGNVDTVKDDTGKTLTLLGPFSNRQIAEEALHELQIVGYKNAFIIEHTEDNISSDTSRHIKYRYNENRIDVNTLLDEKTLKKWNRLTPEQRTSMVYREGVLLVNDGTKFIPFKTL